MTVPCRDCSNRHIACHDSCDVYKMWKQEFDAVKERAIKCRMTEKMLNDRRNKAIERMHHSKKN